VIPFVEKNFKVATDARNRALAGLSMGGLQTLYAGIKNNNPHQTATAKPCKAK
jgi:enterochelin esterase-like enzyme